MRWIDKSPEERVADVAIIDSLIERENPDRFWYSSDQDGDDCQYLSLKLPYGQDIYYDVRIVTTQLKALRMLSETFDYVNATTIPQELLDRVGIVGEEQFEISHNHDQGILYCVVIDVPGLTHVVIDNLMDDFLRRDGTPPQPRKSNAMQMVKRLMAAQKDGKLEYYSVI